MIDQEQYTTRILSDFHMENCNSVKTPCLSYHLSTDMCPKNDEERLAAAKLPYCAIVGKVMYLSTCTRPDISFAVRELAKFMSNYGTKHFEAAKHLLRYLQGRLLRLPTPSDLRLPTSLHYSDLLISCPPVLLSILYCPCPILLRPLLLSRLGQHLCTLYI
jgi:hypothetical protein